MASIYSTYSLAVPTSSLQTLLRSVQIEARGRRRTEDFVNSDFILAVCCGSIRVEFYFSKLETKTAKKPLVLYLRLLGACVP